MKVFQHSLPFNARGENEDRQAFMDWGGTHGDWWYVEHRTREFECLYANESGTFYFGGKELSRIVPVVWNVRREAARVARKQGGRVKKYPYTLSVR